jgi:16S rRNA (adenine1518-N6/adenine1519-N6)-dimethyltransferase
MIKKKSLGQHFLTSSKAIDDIVSAGKVSKEDTVVEIGPGEGVLTKKLLWEGARVIAVEKDDRLIPELSKTFAKEIASEQLNLIHADILEREIPLPEGNYKVVANIPYYITGRILRMFLEGKRQPTSMTLLVQKEVAERIVARDGKESLLSLSVKIFGEPRMVRIVGRGAFNPPPNVDSAVIHIENISKKNLQEFSEKDFFALIHAGFAHKRKQLLPNLTSIYPKNRLEDAFAKTGIDSKCRAEDVPLLTWISLCTILSL